MNAKHHRSLKTGLSIIELLVSIVVMAALFAILQPVVVGLRGRSTQAIDAAQLRQLWIASKQFSSDHRNLIIVGVDKNNKFGYGVNTEWFKLLRPYLGSKMDDKETIPVYISPGDPSKGGAEKLGPTRAFKFRSYGVNARTEYRSSVKAEDGTIINRASDPLDARKISVPSKLVIMGNVDIGTVGDTAGINSLAEVYINGTLVPKKWFGNGQANFLFLDGHIESLETESILQSSPNFPLFDRTIVVE